mgnify:CR=1 FL=1
MKEAVDELLGYDDNEDFEDYEYVEDEEDEDLEDIEDEEKDLDQEPDHRRQPDRRARPYRQEGRQHRDHPQGDGSDPGRDRPDRLCAWCARPPEYRQCSIFPRTPLERQAWLPLPVSCRTPARLPRDTKAAPGCRSANRRPAAPNHTVDYLPEAHTLP